MPVSTDVLPRRYRGATRIAVGGMGEIYRATDDVLGRKVAVKVLADRYAEDESIRKRFRREALAAARLSGEPNTVTIFDVGDWHDRPFIVMEYLSRGSLEEVLRREGAQPPARALGWLGQAAAALDHARTKGVVHRDVKPGNLLLDAQENVHVADFGIASAAGLASLTATGTVLGTAGYISPEQAQGLRATAASDIYALGVVAFELLTGRRPYERDSLTAEATAHVNEPVPSASQRSGLLPAAVDAVFERALAKSPAARYSSGGELVAALRAALQAPAAKPRSRRRWPLAIALLAVVAIAAAVAAAVLSSGGGHRSATTLVRTVTTKGQTKTVTTTAPSPPPPASPPASGTPQQLVDRATGLIRSGDYAAALPIAQQALAQLRRSGQLYEAYADYDVGTSLAHTGRCAEALPYLAASERIQGHRSEIDADRTYCKSR